MPGMPDVILKAPVLGRFEAFTATVANSPSAKQKLDLAIQLLMNPGQPLVNIAIQLGFYNGHPAVHFEKHWLGLDPNTPAFWPTLVPEPIASIIRLGMLKVCELVKTTQLPAEFWWVMSGEHGTNTWEMSISEGVRQITVMFHTPKFPCSVKTVDSTTTWLSRNQFDPNNGTSTVLVRRAVEPEAPPPISRLAGKFKNIKTLPRKPIGPGPRTGPRARKGKRV